MAHPKLKEVRVRYNYCCGYCGVSEVDVGGELTVDHFLPKVLGGDDSTENLIYCCVRCNQYKGTLDPAGNSDTDLRLLHPLRDDLTEHLREDPEGLMVGLTRTGVYHLTIFQLNREALVMHRLQNKIRAVNDLILFNTIKENADLRNQREELQEYIVSLERQLNHP